MIGLNGPVRRLRCGQRLAIKSQIEVFPLMNGLFSKSLKSNYEPVIVIYVLAWLILLSQR